MTVTSFGSNADELVAWLLDGDAAVEEVTAGMTGLGSRSRESRECLEYSGRRRAGLQRETREGEEKEQREVIDLETANRLEACTRARWRPLDRVRVLFPAGVLVLLFLASGERLVEQVTRPGEDRNHRHGKHDPTVRLGS